MTVKLGILMDPIDNISYKKDSSLAMLWAAAERGWEIYYMEQNQLFQREGVAMAHMKSLIPKRNPDNWYEFGASQTAPLGDLDVLLMRKDPPFDMNFIYTTYLLEQAESAGCLVVNRPASLRDCNEKMFATLFPQCCPPTLVGSDAGEIRAFAKTHGDIILKPLDGMGGASIFRTSADDQNLSVIIETLTHHGRVPAMAQRYLPAIVNGDKRVLVIDGEPAPYCLARIPAAGESRGNLAAGGTGRVQPLSEQDRRICSEVKASLLERGLLFVGLDIIGDYLTEINVTSPTCIREIDAGANLNLGSQLMDAIERRLAAH